MQVISHNPIISRYVFPTVYLGGLGAMLLGMLVFGKSPLPFVAYFVVPLVYAFLLYCFYVVYSKNVWILMDEVVWDGDYVVIRKNNVEDKVHLAEIDKVSASMFVNPKRVTLFLSKESKLGTSIAFCPRLKFHLFSMKCDIIDELMSEITKIKANNNYNESSNKALQRSP